MKKVGEVGSWQGAIGLAAVAGMRAVLAPALLTGGTRRLRRRHLIRLAAATELLLDKAPFAGPRISPPALVARMASGAYVARARRPAHVGSVAAAALGATTALISAAFTYRARRALTARFRSYRAANVALGIAEDLLAFGLGRIAAARHPRPAVG